eukprot:TRINITY_DN1566_c1_g1_i1.p1 TRINITY_DN1566_c1_g1~~TRINITY_DN1566_c1_g1_i1.p1  ORF type:complete len:576 (+),score=133.40 TRINITY_DN1566_c1_g1_i1:78-1730(+)
MASTVTDPRTGLPMAMIPNSEHLKFGDKLKNKVIYWFGYVLKVNRTWGKQKRMLIITERLMYFLKMGSNKKLTRGIEIGHIKQVILDPRETWHIGLKIGGAGQYDCCFKTASAMDMSDILRILTIVRKHIFNSELPTRNVENTEKFAELLGLERPKGWKARVDLQLTDQSEMVKHQEVEEQQEMQAQASHDDDRRAIRESFNKMELRNRLQSYRHGEILEAQRELEGYVAMIDERDREIDTLKQQYLSLTENPEFWRSCPRCKAAQNNLTAGITSPEGKRKIELERQLEDYRQLIYHLQQSRATGNLDGLMESSQVAQMRKEVEDGEEKVKMLQKLIIDNPYPTEDVRIRADQIAEGEVMHKDSTPKARELHGTIAELQRQFALRDRELKHSKNLMKDAFKRQVDELAQVRQQFQLYDEHIVDYLEKVFSGNAFPQGEESHGQTAKQLAQATSQAARQAATPPAFPQHTASVHMPHNGQVPFSSRFGSRNATSPINQFVPPNVISAPLPPATPNKLTYDEEELFAPGTATPTTNPGLAGMGRGSGRRSIL